jgi:hypothetical protein
LVAGIILTRDHKLLSIDLEEILAKVAEISGIIKKTLPR